MSEPIFDIQNAKVFRKENVVFENLSMSVSPGENIAILGPNGAGKTTLLKLLAREIYPVVQSDSHIKIFGDENINLWQLREKIGVVSHDFQNRYEAIATGLDVVLSAFFGSIGIHQHNTITVDQISQAEQALAQYRVYDLRDKQYLSLSTGQQRRLLLARATVHKPQVMIFDEPTTSLDVSAAFQIIEDMRQLSVQGTTVILVTHHIHEIFPEIERVVLMEDGEISFDGEKSDALTSERLSLLFQAQLLVTNQNGFYQWAPNG